MGIVSGLLQVYVFVLIVYVVLSYVPRPPEPLMPFVRAVRGLVDPVLRPMRERISPLRVGGVALDLSIIILFILLQLLIVVFAGLGL